jgi:hypothetical protein
MLHTDFRTDIAVPLQDQVTGFANPLAGMQLTGARLTTPDLAVADDTSLPAQVLQQDSVSAEQIPTAGWI